MEYSEYYRALALASTRAYGSKIQTGSGGNISARIAGTKYMIVKSSGGSFADCDERGAGFVLTDLNGHTIAGSGKPTKEIFLHSLIYKISGWNAVVHCHSPWTVAWSLGNTRLPLVTLQAQLKIGSEVPVLGVKTPVLTERDSGLVEELFIKNPGQKAFILSGHGLVALGEDPIAAEQLAELIEETAQVACINKLINN